MGEIIDGQPLFPGESEVDQVVVIHNTLGNFPAPMKQAVEKKGIRGLRDLPHRDGLDKR